MKYDDIVLILFVIIVCIYFFYPRKCDESFEEKEKIIVPHAFNNLMLPRAGGVEEPMKETANLCSPDKLFSIQESAPYYGPLPPILQKAIENGQEDSYLRYIASP